MINGGCCLFRDKVQDTVDEAMQFISDREEFWKQIE